MRSRRIQLEHEVARLAANIHSNYSQFWDLIIIWFPGLRLCSSLILIQSSKAPAFYFFYFSGVFARSTFCSMARHLQLAEPIISQPSLASSCKLQFF